MSPLGQIINLVLTLYLGILFARMILSWVPMFAPSWRPRGPMLVIAETIYTLTDPPINFFRKFIPPLRIGNGALDLSFMVVWFLVLILLQLTVVLF